ncbi:D-3-phosphoglycerate dehydrogenase [Microthyrium microscopicum]|uniref:D-3-phosphoglycerate dehydrogenase n=1 Tax=Microthyrium microscopicum TaxID=703497 RepID=A0A6A6UEN5_9PEZI|nr:D-3-phosphoglycerate dehydrogenase [Microthyrium microscopicum]
MAIPAAERPQVLVPEKVSPDGLALLQKTLDVHEKKGLTPEKLLEIIGDYEALIVRSETKVTETLLKAAKKLKVVARAGVGVDNVDVPAATKLGIIVVNSPAGNINAAAEQTIALMMSTARYTTEAAASMKASKWERSKFVGTELKGKTLAIIGLGKVGFTVARIAKGFGMTVIAYDPYANQAIADAQNITVYASLHDCLKLGDYVTVHTPLMPATRGMIGTKELEAMKPTAKILNVGRGGVIDEPALLEALEAGKLAGAGLDVFTSEPPAADSVASKLVAHPAVVATPHLGASTKEAQENVSIDVCEQVIAILGGELPRSAVNAPIILPEEYRTLQPFVNLVERIGSLYSQHYGAKQQSGFRTTFDLSYEGAIASLGTTKPLFAALVKGLVAPVSDINVNVVNAELVAKERGFLINEQRSREHVEEGFASFITLRARTSRSASHSRVQESKEQPVEQIIQGYVSANTPYISRVDRFRTNFVPQGNLLICRNIDRAGKIGYVGSQLGKHGVNINFMSVAPLQKEHEGTQGDEALMILGIDKPVGEDIVKGLIGDEGVLEARVVTLAA